jgi:hypothetical protein
MFRKISMMFAVLAAVALPATEAFAWRAGGYQGGYRSGYNSGGYRTDHYGGGWNRGWGRGDGQHDWDGRDWHGGRWGQDD